MHHILAILSNDILNCNYFTIITLWNMPKLKFKEVNTCVFYRCYMLTKTRSSCCKEKVFNL